MTGSIRNFEKLNFTPKSSVFCSSQGQTSKYDRLAQKLVRDYASIYVKFINCHQRVKFLRVCLENDIIPDFLRFRVPENGVFSNELVNSFQTKFLRMEINKARTDEKNVEVKLERARGVVEGCR